MVKIPVMIADMAEAITATYQATTDSDVETYLVMKLSTETDTLVAVLQKYVLVVDMELGMVFAIDKQGS